MSGEATPRSAHERFDAGPGSQIGMPTYSFVRIERKHCGK